MTTPNNPQPQSTAEPQPVPAVVEETSSSPSPESPQNQAVENPLAAELVRVTQERDELRDKLQRTLADHVNFQKRARAQAELEIKYAVGPLAAELLQVVDNLERALDAVDASASDHPATASLRDGVAMVHKQLLDILNKHGVKPIVALHQPFDPHHHEALTNQPSSDHPAGTVLHEHRKGYLHHDRLLRPAQVVVACDPSQSV
jgi:molecular chaperone GrpE